MLCFFVGVTLGRIDLARMALPVEVKHMPSFTACIHVVVAYSSQSNACSFEQPCIGQRLFSSSACRKIVRVDFGVDNFVFVVAWFEPA